MRNWLCLVVLFLPSMSYGQQFIRVEKQKDKIISLETAITHYIHKNYSVDLVGVVHVGDRDYYRDLQKRLKSYDVVLYELVAEPGTKPAKKKDGGFAVVHKILTLALDLESQMTAIDYHKDNFVHADLSWDSMMEAAKSRGDNGLTLGLSFLVDTLRKQNLDANQPMEPDLEIDFEDALQKPNILKRAFAKRMVESTDLGPTLQRLLVKDRNLRTLQVMTEQVAKGKKKIAIFYGAAHNADFDKRLRKDYAMSLQGQEWLTAWDMQSDDPVDPAFRILRFFLEK